VTGVLTDQTGKIMKKNLSITKEIKTLKTILLHEIQDLEWKAQFFSKPPGQ